MTLLELFQAAEQHDEAEDELDPASAKQEGEDQSVQFPVVGDAVRDKGDGVGRHEVEDDGEGREDDAEDDGAREGWDLADLRGRVMRGSARVL